MSEAKPSGPSEGLSAVEQASAFNKLFDIAEAFVDEATRFASPKTRHLYDWWASANGGRMPARRMFDIVEHKPIVANVFLTEVTPEGEFVFKLMGEEVIRIVGRNNTGQRVKSEAMGEYGHALHDYYRSIVETGRCKRCEGSLLFAGKQFLRFEAVDCPLAGPDGRVSAIIGVMDIVAGPPAD